jgi:hypothetical protein
MADDPIPDAARRWLTTFAAELGTEPPDDDTIAALLDLAGVAAHASQRAAAPLACWMVARAGVAPAEGLATAQSLPSTADGG